MIGELTGYLRLGRDRLERMLREAERAVARTSAVRRDLPPGSSRAKVTSANARWSRACEERDRVLAALAELPPSRGEVETGEGKP